MRIMAGNDPMSIKNIADEREQRGQLIGKKQKNVDGRILVIDDNENLCRSLELVFDKKGYSTKSAYTGAEALEKIRQEKFDIGLLDMRLPDIKGTELLKELSQKNPEMDVIVITGHATVDDAVESLTSIATDYMIKPLDMDNVLNTVEGIFEKRRLIQEKREAEEALRSSEQRFRSLVSSLHDIVFIIDDENRYADYFCSDSHLLYLPPSEFLNKHISEVLPPEVSGKFTTAIQRVRETEQPETIEYHLNFDGKQRWFETEISLHENGSDMIASVKEITEQVNAKKQLETAVELYISTIEAVDDCILVVDNMGYPMHWNDKFVDIWTINIEDMGTMTALEIFQEFDFLLEGSQEFIEILESIDESKREATGILEFRDGRAFEWYTAPIIEQVELVARVWTFSDITQLKRAEESAYLYLDLLGHDVRNHLQGITIGVDILESANDSETVRAAMNTLREGISKTSRLIDKVKSTENLPSSKLRTRRLDHAVAHVAEDCRSRFSDTNLIVEIEVQEAKTPADEHLEYLIMNLVENAVQENPRETKKVWINLSEAVNGFELSVKDNGTGLSDNRKKELFNSSRRYGGIGLHQVKQIAEKYGGYIHVKDRVPNDYSQGAEFKVYFPAAD
ncbi:MAG: response regulator [Candidatus Lokiarchaeota archaeon]|nr:response regulator [Candidatus Lokiarchaeota archaeon]